MKQILTLSVTELTKELFISFMLIVKQMIDDCKVMSEKMAYYVALYTSAYDRLNYVYEKFDVRFLTEKVQNADMRRMGAFRKLRDMIRYAQVYPENEEQREAARILLEIITQYGCDNISRLKLGERTAVLANLIEDYESTYAAQVETVGYADLLANLHQAQDQFMEVYMERIQVDSELGLKATAEARKQMTDVYRDLVAAVNLAAKRDTAGEFTAFINMMNVEIRKNFIHTGQSASGAGSGSGSDGEDGEIVVPYAIATFHFADHTEEEVVLPVGSLLVAPENTEGYVWEPVVPELMPAEDTAYYEMPASSEEELPNDPNLPTDPDNPNEGDDPNEGGGSGEGDDPNEGDEPNEGGDDTPKPVATILFRNKDYQTIYTLTRKAGEEISAEDWPSPEEEGYRWNMTRSKVNDIIANLTTDTTITVQAVS